MARYLDTINAIDIGGTRKGAFIYLRGYKELMRAFRHADEDMYKEAIASIRQAGYRVRDDARGRAPRLTGAFARSIRLRMRATGIAIRSTDPGAAVIEYATPGAIQRSGPWAGKRAGVPHGAPTKAMTKAVEDNTEYVVSEVTKALQMCLDRIRGE